MIDPQPQTYTGACPIKVRFPSRITVAGGAGTVTWLWESSDGDRSPEQKTIFDRPGTADVSSSWTFDETPGPNGYAYQSIQILDPVMDRPDSQYLSEVMIEVHCT
jgi:hypothetical protein